MTGSGIFLDTIARFEGCSDTINLVHILNTSNCKIHLSERNLCSSSTQWVYIVNDVLSPQHETVAIVSERREW
jgi:hypothetical protein